MKRRKIVGAGKYLDGYTVVEVLIFLAVSGALLATVSVLITGRQEKVRFSQSVVALEQELQDTFNDVSTGYFPSNSDFTCTTNGTNVSATKTTSTEQGSNEGCVFVGKLLHFYAEDVGPSGSVVYDSNKYKVFTLVGSKNINSLTSGQIRLLGYGNTQGVGIVEERFLQHQLQLEGSVNSSQRMIRNSATGERYHSAVILSDFNSESGGARAKTGNASSVSLYGYKGWEGDGSLDTTPNDLQKIDGSATLVICLAQDGNGKPAALQITGQLTIERYIGNQPDICN